MVGAASATASPKIRVVIGDDGTDTRRKLQLLLVAQPDVDVVGVADDGEVALGLIRLLKPDVALLDADLPSFGGGAIARVIRSEQPDLQVVVLSDEPQPVLP
jgi:DNA-binding NarL/FixJ family response regulator